MRRLQPPSAMQKQIRSGVDPDVQRTDTAFMAKLANNPIGHSLSLEEISRSIVRSKNSVCKLVNRFSPLAATCEDSGDEDDEVYVVCIECGEEFLSRNYYTLCISCSNALSVPLTAPRVYARKNLSTGCEIKQLNTLYQGVAPEPEILEDYDAYEFSQKQSNKKAYRTYIAHKDADASPTKKKVGKAARFLHLSGSNGSWTRSDDVKGGIDNALAQFGNNRFDVLENSEGDDYAISDRPSRSIAHQSNRRERRPPRGRGEAHNNALNARARKDDKARKAAADAKFTSDVLDECEENPISSIKDKEEDPTSWPLHEEKEKAYRKIYGGMEGDRIQETADAIPILVRTRSNLAGHSYGWDGKQVCTWDAEMDKFVGRENQRVYDYLYEGELVPNVVKSSYGYIHVSRHDLGKVVCTQAAVIPVIDRDHRYKDYYFPGVDALIFTPLYHDLAKAFPFCVYSVAVSKNMISYSSKHYTFLPVDMVKATIDWFIRSTFEKNVSVHGVRNLNKEAVGKIEEISDVSVLDMQSSNVRGGVIHDHELPFVENSVECTVPCTWEYDLSCVDSTASNGCTLTEEEGIRFNTQGVGRQWKMTRFFSLIGIGCFFTTYSNSTNNAQLAFKRILGKRDGEEQLDSNQLELANYLCRGMMYKHKTWTPYIPKLPRLQVRHRLVPAEKFEMNLGNVLRKIFTKQIFQKCSRATIDMKLSSGSNLLDWAYLCVYETFLYYGWTYDQRRACANIEHIKKKLRQMYVENQAIHVDIEVMVNKCKSCIKRELAKFGKVPRFFVTYDAGCMYANYLPEFIKMCLDGPIVCNIGHIDLEIYVMAKPRDGDLDRVFTNLIQSRGMSDKIYAVIYSDDSVVSGKVGGRAFTYNMDISSCDSGNRELVFSAVWHLMCKFSKEHADGLLAQCMKPLVIVNPCDEEEKMAIQFIRPLEGSGNVLTTILNHVANIFIVLSIGFRAYEKVNEDFTWLVEEDFHIAARRVGHNISLEDCNVNGHFCIEKMQFLKHSFMECEDGVYRSKKNISCTLRALGGIEDNLEARHLGVNAVQFSAMTYSERMDQFVSGVIQGECHEPGCIILDALRSRFSLGTVLYDYDFGSILTRVGNNTENGVSPYRVKTSSFKKRYEVSDGLLDELVDLIVHVKCGQIVAHEALSVMYRVDYGLVRGEQDRYLDNVAL